MFMRLLFLMIATVIGLGAYTYSRQQNPVDLFLASTDELVASGDLDRNLFERIMQPPADPNVSDFMVQVSAQYLGHLAAAFRETRGESFKGIAINEPYEPDTDAIWVYIFEGHDNRFGDLRIRCNAIAYPERDVVLIDTSLLNSISRALMCSGEVGPAGTWIEDPSSIVGGTASLFGLDWRDYFSRVPLDAWRMFGGAIVEIDYRGRAMLPLLIVGHEIGHLALHRQQDVPIWQLLPDRPDVVTHMAREIQADDFAIETLIMALADQEITTVDQALAVPNTWHIEALATNQAVQEKLRFFTLVMSGFQPSEIIPDLQIVDAEGSVLRARPDGVQIVDMPCDARLIYARRLIGLAVTFGHYTWRAYAAAAGNGDMRSNPELVEDEYYSTVRDRISRQIIDCDLNDLY